jgi:hypothetical protein
MIALQGQQLDLWFLSYLAHHSPVQLKPVSHGRKNNVITIYQSAKHWNVVQFGEFERIEPLVINSALAAEDGKCHDWNTRHKFRICGQRWEIWLMSHNALPPEYIFCIVSLLQFLWHYHQRTDIWKTQLLRLRWTGGTEIVLIFLAASIHKATEAWIGVKTLLRLVITRLHASNWLNRGKIADHHHSIEHNRSAKFGKSTLFTDKIKPSTVPLPS